MAKRLTLEETKNLLKAWRVLNDKNALELLVISNIGLVKFIAKKYLGKGLTFAELESAGNLGLLNAINKFDYEARAIEGFSTYLSVSIERTVLSELQKYNKHSHVFSISAPIGQNKDGDELKIEDIIGSDTDELIENVISEMKIDIVREALQCLTSKEQKIILLRYGLDDAHRKSLQEIGEMFNCSRTTIENIEKRALIKMRHPRNTKRLKDFIEE